MNAILFKTFDERKRENPRSTNRQIEPQQPNNSLRLYPGANPTLRQLHPASSGVAKIHDPIELRHPLILHNRGNLGRRTRQDETRLDEPLHMAAEHSDFLRSSIQEIPHRVDSHDPIRDQSVEEPQEL